jgi:sortase A
MLEIPSIGLSQPFFEGVTLTAINNGPSHWPGTPMPGELGNMVIAGHRITHTRPFFDLDLAKPGDELIFTMDKGGRYVYTLDRIEIVDANALHIVDQSYGYRATLFGCHPKGSSRQRIVGHFTLKSSTPA